ncbi:stage III sporulation protein AE [Caldisalinibacter kiritimatiensis]|uniref:Stage III sporulation protein AE n=1 Tax=Caldisalinibacter kiritimatiensis TaxID=1304284 RepID=R1CBS0_9FIRM|nr:stage III sporulation protein AE [Caldisalinibacter kiritimatiensis]EOC99764.1 Stage III sporulation protein AE [Caldisalinibacter kiritimatiensis]
MKRTILIAIIIIFIPHIIFGIDSRIDDETSTERIIQEQIKALKLDELQKLINEINERSSEELPKINFKQYLVSLLKGEQVLSNEEILKVIFRLVCSEIVTNAGLIAKLIILAIICAILTNIQSAFENNTVGELSYYVCYLILIAIVIKSFALGLEIGRSVIDDMVVFMQALLPVLITLLLAVGGITSSALFHPLILGALNVISTMMKDIILPLILISAVIGIISKLSDKVQISRLAGLIRQGVVSIIGISLTIFLGVISIQGTATAKVDGVTIRTAKFAVDTFIPIVGGFLSDAMDTVVGCSMLLKNAIGIIGLIVLFIICAVPLIKIISLVIIYKITAVVIEPISDRRIVDSLSEVSKSFVIVFATVASVVIMFFMAITIIISAGNITVMMR